MEINRLGNIYGEDKGTGYAGNVWDKEGLCPTLNTMQGGNREPMIIEDFYKNRKPRVYDETAPTIRAEREGLKVIEEEKTYLENAIEQIIEKNNGEIPEAWDLYNKNPINNGISKTLSTDCGHTGTAGATVVTHNYRIRKLTPKECWRLMAFTDEDFHKAEKVNSNSQLYRQSGNSIVVSVLEAIFRNLNIQNVQSWEEINEKSL